MSYLEILLLVPLLFRAGSHLVLQPQSMYLLQCVLDEIGVVGSMKAGDRNYMSFLDGSCPSPGCDAAQKIEYLRKSTSVKQA